jgi:hemolysin III
MKTTFYHPKEEKINVISHFSGLLLSAVALILLVIRAGMLGNTWHIVSYSIYGVSLVVLYLASTLYHNAKNPKTRAKLNIFDHAAIYVLIAGTYTPFTLVTLNGTVGWVLFGLTWGAAITGIIFKVFYFGKYDKLSTVMYVLMGWMVVFALKPLSENLSAPGMFWLFMGGVFYTVGALFYAKEKWQYNHATFHIFVLLGSISHFISVFFYTI